MSVDREQSQGPVGISDCVSVALIGYLAVWYCMLPSLDSMGATDSSKNFFTKPWAIGPGCAASSNYLAAKTRSGFEC